MRISGFEVRVTSPEGVPFHEVKDPNSRDVYIVASPGSRFEIRVEVLPESSSGGRLHSFNVKVDGRSIGVRKTLGQNKARHSFVGFVREGNSKRVTFDLFKFAAAPQEEDTKAQSLDFKEGCIVIRADQVMYAGRKINKATTQYNNASVKVPKLPEGKKFFMAPSLTTTSGGSHTTSGFNNNKYTKVRRKVAVFKLRYETPSTLLLRQILRRDNPAHAAILDSFPETRQQPQPAASMMGSVTTQPRIKRERGGSGAPEVIDLVGPSRISPQVEQLAPGEELVCDLTAEEDAPRWAKRQHTLLSLA